MCEQTEINYLDGDIVWVKLGACWWPGQVTSFPNLPEDIQIEFQKKQLIAAVKFFQEDTYEFVKNLHQIYKYNCTQKDEFIRKGLDKYRTKSKDGSTYMDKFPGDVEMAEKLTGGDPDILTSEKFCREEKPDISALFGEKKIPKKKRDRDEMNRRSDGNIVTRKITHPRFLRESDHEIRIRQQPSSMPSTPKTPSTDSPQFSCNLCNFTSTRVNVIICHRKSHCSGGEVDSPIARGKITSYAQSKSSGRPSLPSETQKRKYVRKTKSLSSNKSKGERESEPVKRKLGKQLDKTTAKKKKTDPELREKLLADWDDETDEDMDLDLNKTADTVSIGSSSIDKNTAVDVSIADNADEKDEEAVDNIIEASEKLLRETEKFTSLSVDDSSSRASRQSNNKHLDDLDSETDTSTSTLAKDDKSPAYKRPKKLIASTEERKSTDKDEKQSRFSCFDFDEEDLPEPTITPVRKIPRIFGKKNTSVKKEILKKFTMSQALKNVEDEEKEKDRQIDDKASNSQDFFDKQEPTVKEKKLHSPDREKKDTVECHSAKEQRDNDDETKVETPTKSDETPDKSSKAVTVTELEIVEIFEVEGEKDEHEENDDVTKKSMSYEIETFPLGARTKKFSDRDESSPAGETRVSKGTTKEMRGDSRREKNLRPEKDETMSELATTETEDETMSEMAESLRGNSENSDTDGNLNRATWSATSTTTVDSSRDVEVAKEKPAPRRRGRPRKSLSVVDSSGNGNDSPRHELISKQVAALVSRDAERKTSESDSERSYSGRRRKPNKRYLHSELYTSSPDNRASRTDESQSETEEKSQKEHKTVRGRRGKNKTSVGSAESRLESIDKDQELELSNKTFDTTDRALPTEVANLSATGVQAPSRISVKSPEVKSDRIEDEGESSVSGLSDFRKIIDSGIGTPAIATKSLPSGETDTSSPKNVEERAGKWEKSQHSREKQETIIETVTMTSEDMETCLDEVKSSPKIDAVKTRIDKLPPKKSQIKKFELSQIDLLDACAEQVAAEQAAAEKLIADKLAAEKLAAEKIAAEKLAAEKLAAEKMAAEKLAAEKIAAEKLAAEEKRVAEKLAEEKRIADKLAEEKRIADKLAEEERLAEKLAEEKRLAEKLAEEKRIADKLAEEKRLAEKLAEERRIAEKLAEEKRAAEILAEEKRVAEALAEEKRIAEKLAEEKRIADEIAAEKLAAEKLAAEQLAAEKLAAEKLAAEKLAAEKLAAEQLAAAEKLAAEKLAAEKLAAEQELAEKAEAEKAAAEEERRIAEEKKAAEEEVATEEKPATEGTMIDESSETIDVSSKQASMIQTSSETVEKNDSASNVTENVITEAPVKDSTMETIEAVLARITNEEVVAENKPAAEVKTLQETKASDTSTIDNKQTIQIPVDVDAAKKSSTHSRYKAKFTPELSPRVKKVSSDDEIPINSFQEAFLKTLHIDKKDEKDESTTDAAARKAKQQNAGSSENAETQQQTVVIALTGPSNETVVASSNAQETQTQNVQPLNAMTEFEGVEILVQENIAQVETKIDEGNANQMDLTAALVGTDAKQDGTSTLSLDLQKIQDTLSDNVMTPSPSSDISMPVKKREKPRIIENVALKEPMQILKNKLLEKLPSKSTKHKLDTEGNKKGVDSKGAPRAKMMRMDSAAGNSKAKSPAKTTAGPHFTITRKLQALKVDEAATAAVIEKEKAAAQAQIAQAMSITTGGEKFIQQSSQSLADMELDINSMPFVLSEDVLTPESIEHMPVVITSIVPSSSSSTSSSTSSSSTSVQTTLAPTSASQSPASNSEIMYKSATSETITTESTSTGKKKSGTPAILKNKAKAKPTITSIKTLVPPFAGGVKGLKFQNQQSPTGKAMPLISQKSATPGKYVIVQTASGQHMRYSVQGKPGSQQKIAIPAGKTTGSAQIVQQGGKVVILTSAQSGQTKMLPLNISKSMSGKVQKIANNKGQIYAPINAQGIIGQKAMIAPKTDTSSPTTSKLAQGQKLINAQGIITSKGVLTPISTTKSGLLGTLSQGILTKGGIYTPISSAQLAGKTLIGGKTLVSKATTILSPLGTQTLGATKGTIIAPMSHTIAGKTIINAQGLVTPKGTVLTPITGQQVKAIAAKSPAKGAKVQYQSLQQKLQIPMLHKCQKIPVSASMQIRAGSNVKSPSGTVVFQNTIAGTQKSSSPGGKKIVRQTTGQQGTRSPQTAASPSATQQNVQRGKSLGTTPTIQRVAVPRAAGGRQAKQKIVVQKMHDTSLDAASPSSSPTVNTQTKSTIGATSIVGNVAKSSIAGTPVKQASRSGKSGRNAQKNLLNVASGASTSSSISTAGSKEISAAALAPMSATTVTAQTLQNLPVPPLVIPGTELPIVESEQPGKGLKALEAPSKEGFKPETVKSSDQTIEEPKLETAKALSQPQIMALPTESSDGTQTYVLVTIDEQGQIQPLDNNALMSLEGTTQNADGTRTLYIDPSSLGEAGTLDNIVLQFDNGALPNLQGNVGDSSQSIVTGENFPSSEIIQTSNQDILAAALANTDFQQEIGLPDNTTSSVMTTGLQTSLINQTILQSTIIPPTEPISSPSVLETSLTLNQPIMTPLEVPSSLPIQVQTTPASVVSTIPSSLELPITITNPTISYISAAAAAAAGSTSNEARIQIPGNSMPDIGEIMESSTGVDAVRTDIPTSTQYLVLPTLDDSMTIRSQENESGESTSVTYSVSIPDNIVIDNSPNQTTPSMPIIDDGYVEGTEQKFAQVTINEMLVSKASTNSESANVPEENVEPITGQESTISTDESQEKLPNVSDNVAQTFSRVDSYESRDTATGERMIVTEEDTSIIKDAKVVEEKKPESDASMIIDEQNTEIVATCASTVEESSSSSGINIVRETTENVRIESTNSLDDNNQKEVDTEEIVTPMKTEVTSQVEASFVEQRERINTSSLDSPSENIDVRAASASMDVDRENVVVVEEAVEMEIYPSESPEAPDGGQAVEGSSRAEIAERAACENVETRSEETIEASQEAESPSQSYEKFNTSGITSDSTEIPTQSATKSVKSREATQSVAYEAMEIDENAASAVEPPTQSFEDTNRNEASQSYETTMESNTNAPTQSFNEIMQCQVEIEEPSTAGDAIDDQSFPTQSYEVGKIDNLSENLESDASAIGQEGNIPSQSNDIGNDGIGTSSVSMNNSGLNEDETASSSYVPETPENQERDQDQESAISTSSYEIPPCEELNIASSSVIPDTSVRAEHMSIHDNGVPEIPTSSYNLNPDSSSTSHVDALPTSSYEEDHVIVEQNVSTSYEAPISMPGIEENSSQNFVTESTDHRNEPTSYYARHPEVTASYYEAVNQDSNSRLEADPQEEVTPSYYEQPQDVTSEASQSYFRPTPRYSGQSVSPSYYDPTPETEASQSSYYSHEIEPTEQSSSRNVEAASQSFYQETTDERRLRQQGEATPTYTERYPVDYALANSPIERHDLVESSVPATRPAER